MDWPGDLEAARRWYAAGLRATAPIQRDSVVRAFATVPRERFLGPGPWRIHPRLKGAAPHTSATDDPREVQHDVLVSIDEARDLNNGQPSLWALIIDRLAIEPGETVLQVGTGTGYFTAILSEIVGPAGRVLGYEIDERLAARAAEALRDRPRARVVPGDATGARDLPPLDVVVAAAGATHVPEAWLEALAPEGRMVLPLTGEDGHGILLRLERGGDRIGASSLGGCGYYHCEGARDPAEAAALTRLLRDDPPRLDAFHPGPPPRDASRVWHAGRTGWLSREPG